MRSSIRRLAAFLLASVLGVILAGCALASAPEGSKPPNAGPREEPTPAPSITVTDKGPVGTMTFADGASLSADALPQWSDGLLVDDGWTLTSPDDGQGSWGTRRPTAPAPWTSGRGRSST